ncbi:3043_t:CDS:2, partial [Entrophospora sp. SA101]
LVNGIYTKNYQAHPVLTLAFTNGNLMALSDILAQSININVNRKYPKDESEGAKERLHSNEHFDYPRLLRFSLYGFSIAPINNMIFTNTLKRVAVDQIFFAPFGLVFFFGFMGISEGHDYDGIKLKFNEGYFSALKANYTIWPLVQLVNFRFLPLQYRVPFVGSVGVLWSTYLSLLNSKTEI